MSWQQQRRMTPLQFREALQDLRMSQAGCARYLNLSSRQIARMLNGDAKIPVPVALLLSLMLEYRQPPILVEESEP